MAVPESHGSGESPNLFASLRSFWGVLLAILYTRFDLFRAELEDEAARTVRLIIVSLAAMAAICSTFFFLMFLLIASFWDTPYRSLIMGVVVAICGLLSVIFMVIARNLVLERPRFLAQTLAELRHDVEGLRPSSSTKLDETKS
jgi:uncharacterized membrane protein YqjE